MKAKKETGKSKEKKIEKPPAVVLPAALPLFPFGLFLLPLIIPGACPAKMKDVK